MGRSPCCDENGLKKGPWTPEEDQKLVDYIQKHGHGSWRALPKLAGLNRCGKSCRLRWTNYLRPDIKRGKFSNDEEQTILHLHSILGNKWSAIATHLPGRTDNEIKNFWNTHLKKKLIQMGFDPMTHQPRTDLFASLPHLIALVNLKELIEHYPLDDHAMRLQAEAVQLAKFQHFQYLLQSAASLTTNSYDQNNINAADMEVFTSLLNSSLPHVKESLVLNSPQQLDNQTSPYPFASIATSQPLHHSGLLPQLSDPQVPFTYQPSLNNPDMGQDSSLTALINQGDNNNLSESPWILLSPMSVPTSKTETSISNPGDASSSTSSYGGGTSSYWPDQLFFDDPVLHDIS